MSDILKKNWFVVLIAIIFIGFSIFCVYDTNKGKLPGKSADGKQVIASLDGKVNITADDLYNELYNGGGSNLVLIKFQAAIIDESVATDDEIKKNADSIKEYVKSQSQTYATQYGTSEEEALSDMLAQYGYTSDDFDYFCLIQAKLSKMQSDYVEAHLEELFKPMAKEHKGRIVSHILVKMEDANNPTAEEKATVEAIEKDLKSMSFEEVAKKYADKGDTGSAQNGGYLGYMDDTTGYVESFKTQALKMKAGETSEWVKESNTNYNGWHMIRVEETDIDKMMKDEKAKDSIVSAVLSANNDITTKFIKEAITKLDIEYFDEDVKAAITETFLSEDKEK